LTDRQTEISSLDRVCIPCSVLKTRVTAKHTQDIQTVRVIAAAFPNYYLAVALLLATSH